MKKDKEKEKKALKYWPFIKFHNNRGYLFLLKHWDSQNLTHRFFNPDMVYIF